MSDVTKKYEVYYNQTKHVIKWMQICKTKCANRKLCRLIQAVWVVLSNFWQVLANFNWSHSTRDICGYNTDT